jgi:hypothetical protein
MSKEVKSKIEKHNKKPAKIIFIATHDSTTIDDDDGAQTKYDDNHGNFWIVVDM